MQKLQGWVEQGNKLVVSSGTGLASTQRFQGSFPGATVTVYQAGTLNLASIFSDNLSSPTVKANPFTASVSDGSFSLYAANGRYDIQFSGGGIVTPFTLGDFSLSDADAFSLGFIQVTFSATPTFDASQDSIFQMTLTGNVTSSTISNASVGRIVVFRITQDGTGGRTFAWPPNVQTPPTVDPTANLSTEATFYYDGASWWPLFTTPSSVAGGWTDAGTLVRLTTTTDRVSVGDTTLDANIKLEAVGNIRARSAAVVDPTAGAGLEHYYVTASGTGIMRAIDWDQATNKTRPVIVAGRDLSFQTHATTPASLADRLKITTTGEVLIGIATSDPAIRFDSLGRIRAKSNALSAPTTGAGIEIYFNPATPAGSLISVDWAAAVNKMQDTIIAGRNTIFTTHPTDPNSLVETFRVTSDFALNFGQQAVVPALSAASNGRIYFNGTKFRVSENGGGYADLVSSAAGSGWQDDGTIIRQVTLTDQVSVGSATAIAAAVQLGVVRNAASALAAIAAYSNTAGENAALELRRARGTQGAEAAVQAADAIARWDALGFGTSFVAGARIESLARGNWTGASTPASIAFFTVPSGSTVLVERARVTEDGAIQMPSTAAAASDANTGRIRYVSSTQQWEISRNAGNYARIAAVLVGTANLDFGNTAAQTSADLTITVTGAAVGDAVALATPAAPDANTCLTAFVSAVNTVTVRFNNYSAGAIDPANASYTVLVFKQ